MSPAHPRPDPGAGMTWPALDGLARVHGDAFFVFHGAEFRANVSALRTAMAAAAPEVELAYSLKANYTPAVCRLAQTLGMMVEVSSPMELWFAERLGICGRRIVYNGPGKSGESVRAALLVGALVNLESDRDVEWALATVREHPERHFGVGLRCSVATPRSEKSRLGFDAEGTTLEAVAERIAGAGNLSVIGLLSHVPDGSADGLRARTAELVRVAERLFPDGPEVLDLGGSLRGRVPVGRDPAGVPAATFDDYAAAIAEGLRQGVAHWPRHPRIIIEPGAAVASSAFYLYARVIEVKTVRGRDFALVAASVLDTSPNARRVDFPVTVIPRRVSRNTAVPAAVHVCGITPIDGDFLALDLPARPAAGDFVRFDNVGAYSISMRPAFNYPPHAILQTDGKEVTILRARQSYEDVLRGFV
jgi:diaminopimelate decarboxylase